ncbi:hypothetical protein [Companilactobacillus sp.]|uniref:hypothetical protein n=1 Tax=Companilactobacillus sp. TaxID=2767905 RepID=UPI0026209524|nr:hypothetical protein [Companilactobacillus sp.]
MKGQMKMGLFSKKKSENDPADNDFSKISQEIKKSPKKLTQAQNLFKNDSSKRNPAADVRKESESK